jgi:hypothetical protein
VKLEEGENKNLKEEEEKKRRKIILSHSYLMLRGRPGHGDASSIEKKRELT